MTLLQIVAILYLLWIAGILIVLFLMVRNVVQARSIGNIIIFGSVAFGLAICGAFAIGCLGD